MPGSAARSWRCWKSACPTSTATAPPGGSASSGAAGEIALVALTGWCDAPHRKRSGAAGFDAQLVKPVSPPELLERLDTLAPDSSESKGP